MIIIIKLLALDIDGTITNDSGNISNEIITSIELVKSYKTKVCLVTGRRDIDITSIHNLCEKVDYLILNNGAKIVDINNKVILKNISIDVDDAKLLINYCLNNNILLYVTAKDFLGVNIITSGAIEYANSLNFNLIHYSNLDEIPLNNIDGFMINNDGEKAIEFIKYKHLQFSYFRSEDNCIDIIPSNCDKWSSIEIVLRFLGIDPLEIISMGNHANDIEMINKSGIGIAVANAIDELKNAANYVTKSNNNQNPVKEVFEKFIIPKE